MQNERTRRLLEWRPWLFCFGWTLTLALLSLRRVLFQRGLPLFEDLSFPRRLEFYRRLITESWDGVSNARSAFFAQWPLYLPISLLHGPSDWFAKGFMLLTLMVSGLAMFGLVRYVLRDHPESVRTISALVAGTLYVLNPWVYRVIGGYLNMMVGYAFGPLIVLLWLLGTASDGRQRVALASLGGILLGISSIDIRNAAFLVMFGCVYAIAFLLATRGSTSGRSDAIKTSLIMVGWLALFLLPTFLDIGTAQDLNLVGRNDGLFAHSDPLNTFRLDSFYNATPLVSYRSTGFPLLMTFVVPVLIVGAMLSARNLRPGRLALLATTAIFIFLGSGIKGPFGSLYEFLFFDGPLSFFGSYFRESAKIVCIVALCASILAALVVADLWNVSSRYCWRSKSVRISTITRVLLTAAVLCIIVGMLPMVQADIAAPVGAGGGRMALAAHVEPDAYEQTYGFLKDQCRHGKTLALPFDWGQSGYRWNGDNPVSGFFEYSSPVSAMTPTGIPIWNPLWYVYLEQLLRSREPIAADLASMNVECIVVHDDYDPEPNVFGGTPSTVDAALANQPGIARAFSATGSNETLRVFRVENTGPSLEVGTGLDASGGYDLADRLRAIGLTNIASQPSLHLRQRVVGAEPTLSSDDTLITQGDQLSELTAAELPSSSFISRPDSSSEPSTPALGWTRPGILGEGGFGAALNMALSPEDASSALLDSWNYGQNYSTTTAVGSVFDLPLDRPVGKAVVMVRSAVAEEGGVLTVRFDGNTIATIVTKMPVESSMQWTTVPIDISKGGLGHLQIVNQSGSNVIGAVAVLSQDLYNQTQSVVKTAILQHQGGLAALLDAATLMQTAPSVFLPVGKYMVYGSASLSALQIDGTELKPNPNAVQSDGYRSYDEISVDRAGEHSLAIGGFPGRSSGLIFVADELVRPSQSPPVVHIEKITSEGADASVTVTHGDIVKWTSRFDPAWSCLIDGRRTLSFPVDGMFVGCRVPSGQHQVQFIFSRAPRRHLAVVLASAIEVTATGAVLVALVCLSFGSTWRRRSRDG